MILNMYMYVCAHTTWVGLRQINAQEFTIEYGTHETCVTCENVLYVWVVYISLCSSSVKCVSICVSFSMCLEASLPRWWLRLKLVRWERKRDQHVLVPMNLWLDNHQNYHLLPSQILQIERTIRAASAVSFLRRIEFEPRPSLQLFCCRFDRKNDTNYYIYFILAYTEYTYIYTYKRRYKKNVCMWYSRLLRYVHIQQHNCAVNQSWFIFRQAVNITSPK